MTPRLVTANIYANTGTTTAGDSFALEGRIVKAGTLSWSIDAKLTLCQPGDVSLEVEDFDGTLWAYLQALNTDAGFLPPWLEVLVAGERKFLGLIQPDKARRNEFEATVELCAPDWSTMLAETWLESDTWMRPVPSQAGDHSETETRTGSILVTICGWPGGVDFTGLNSWLSVGDHCTCDKVPGTFKVLSFTNGSSGYSVFLQDFRAAYLALYGSVANYPTTVQLTRLASSTTTTDYFSITAATTASSDSPTYVLTLDTVDGITVGDVLQLVNTTTRKVTYTVLDVDSMNSEIITKESVQDHSIGDQFYFDSDTQYALVHQDVRVLIQRACTGVCAVSFDRFTPAVLPLPVFSWLPLRTAADADLLPPWAVGASLSALRVHSHGVVYDGTPDAGWAVSSDENLYADWTTQKTSAPASCMPLRTDTEEIWNYSNYDPYEPPTSESVEIDVVVLYDYLQMRRVAVHGSNRTSLNISTWSGTDWGTDTTTAWTSGRQVYSLALVPGSGELLALTFDTSGANPKIETQSGASYTITETYGTTAVGTAARLINTPWNVYLVFGGCYGRVVVSGGSIRLDWKTVIASDCGTLHAATLCALDQTRLFCLATDTGTDPDDVSKTVTLTSALFLDPEPDPDADTADAVLWSEVVLDGAPRLLGAVRDPSRLERVIGHVGGRLFQVCAELPPTVERLEAYGMSALDLLEAVCSLHNCIAVPTPEGTLEILSRMIPEEVTALTVDEERATRDLSAVFYSVVSVTGSDSSVFEAGLDSDGNELFPGGKLLEIQKHPCAISDSTRLAMAESLYQWFGKPRKRTERTWFHVDATTAAPWEGLSKWALVTVNDDTTPWRVMALQQDLNEGSATATLIEADADAAYGYGAE